MSDFELACIAATNTLGLHLVLHLIDFNVSNLEGVNTDAYISLKRVLQLAIEIPEVKNYLENYKTEPTDKLYAKIKKTLKV